MLQLNTKKTIYFWICCLTFAFALYNTIEKQNVLVWIWIRGWSTVQNITECRISHNLMHSEDLIGILVLAWTKIKQDKCMQLKSLNKLFDLNISSASAVFPRKYDTCMVQVTFKRQRFVNFNTVSPTWTGHRLGELRCGEINSTAIGWRGSLSFEMPRLKREWVQDHEGNGWCRQRGKLAIFSRNWLKSKLIT